MTKNEINSKMVKLLGLTHEFDEDGMLYAAKKHPGENVLSISTPVDFTRDWNLVMETVIKYNAMEVIASAKSAMDACTLLIKYMETHNVK